MSLNLTLGGDIGVLDDYKIQKQLDQIIWLFKAFNP